jgi:hypothetical protein
MNAKILNETLANLNYKCVAIITYYDPVGFSPGMQV